MCLRRSRVSFVSASVVISVPAIVTVAGGRLVEPGEDVHQRRLAGARGAHDGDELARRDVERDAAKRVDGRLAFAVAAREIDGGDDGPCVGRVGYDWCGNCDGCHVISFSLLLRWAVRRSASAFKVARELLLSESSSVF